MEIKEIVQQLESCEFECVAGPLGNNVAFIRLKEIAKREYKTKRYIGEKMYTENGTLVEVIALTGRYSSQQSYNIKTTVCKNIYQDDKTVDYDELFTKDEYKEREIEKARAILKRYDAV